MATRRCISLLATGIASASGLTPLHRAAHQGHDECIERLLKKKDSDINQREANVDAADSDGDTPLHIAAVKGRRRCIEVLISHGANTNIRNVRLLQQHAPRSCLTHYRSARLQSPANLGNDTIITQSLSLSLSFERDWFDLISFDYRIELLSSELAANLIDYYAGR